MSRAPGERVRRGIPLRAVVPNAVTALALCSALFGIRFAIAGEWRWAVGAIIVAAVLDGLDGRIARMLHGASRFGAELDSLSDVTAFGVAPAIILYQWVLQPLERGSDLYEGWVKFGWLFALSLAVCAALRLARFNANIDVEDQPHKSAGFLTGVPAPAGAGLALLPLYLWLAFDAEIFRHPMLVAPWLGVVAFLMISSIATFSWTSLRLRRSVRLGALVAIALIGAALFSAPWPTLSAFAIAYALLIPFSVASYARVRRRRAVSAAPTDEPEPRP
ncbi:MAG: CDP-alcohol phosphatidyltransferase family protein [Allosphingosinicella sp.]|uniref:CDP-alcohol phosphatidyltransferase family protein n=1 Tax=Allosphingosinicella sp. TaxID=2823234 RepID=UPI0039514299